MCCLILTNGWHYKKRYIEIWDAFSEWRVVSQRMLYIHNWKFQNNFKILAMLLQSWAWWFHVDWNCLHDEDEEWNRNQYTQCFLLISINKLYLLLFNNNTFQQSLVSAHSRLAIIVIITIIFKLCNIYTYIDYYCIEFDPNKTALSLDMQICYPLT